MANDPLGIGEPVFCLTGVMYQRLRGPVVYAWIRDGVPLYIGVGSNGIDRPFSSGHHVLTNRRVLPDDSVLIWEAKSSAVARRLECDLIRRFRPEFNAKFDDAVSSKPRRGAYGLWRRDNSWVVEFIHRGLRYKKSLGPIPFSLAKTLAAEYRLSVLVKTMPPIEDRPINGRPTKPKRGKVTTSDAAPSPSVSAASST